MCVVSQGITSLSQLIECEAVNLQVTLETFPVHPRCQAAIFILYKSQQKQIMNQQKILNEWMLY